MSLFSKYAKELKGIETYEIKKGFIQYIFMDERNCYISDFFVDPEFRKTHTAKNLIDYVIEKAKEHGCEIVSGEIDLTQSNPERIMQFVLKLGFKIDSATPSSILVYKGVDDE